MRDKHFIFSVTLFVVTGVKTVTIYDIVNGKEKWEVKTQLPDLSMQYLSFVRMLGSSQSGRQVPVFESLATRHTLHSVGNGFLEERV